MNAATTEALERAARTIYSEGHALETEPDALAVYRALQRLHGPLAPDGSVAQDEERAMWYDADGQLLVWRRVG